MHPLINLLRLCPLCTLLLATQVCAQSSPYIVLEKAIDCFAEFESIESDGKPIPESVKIKSLDCWLGKNQRQSKKIILRSEKLSKGFMQTAEFGHIRMEFSDRGSYELYMQKQDQQRLKVFLAK